MSSMFNRTAVGVLAVCVASVSFVALLWSAQADRPVDMPRPSTQPLPANEGFVQVHVFNSEGQLTGPVEVQKVVKTDEAWQAQLTKEQYEIARGKGTERPFCGTLLDNKKEGAYACICCDLPLFGSKHKFNSGTGWPSFFSPVAETNVAYHRDDSHGMSRIEILCARCDAHLGHVFDDGPKPTGLRYCVNSESLKFVDESELKSLAEPEATTQPAQKP